MLRIFKNNGEPFFIFVTVVIALLVLFSVVPNSFGISLIGFFVTLIWLGVTFKNSTSLLDHFLVNEKYFIRGLRLWLLLIVMAAGLHAWARFIGNGYDLYWFTQAVTNAKVSGILHTSSERLYPSLLAQHWEPILYTAIPLSFLFSGSVAVMVWQALGLCGGAWGAWKLCSFLFDKSSYQNLKYFLTILFVVGWVNLNPLSFDIHPPVFGSLLFIPWIVYFIVSGKNKFFVMLLLLLLAQCGEIFLSIVPAYLVYLLLEHKKTILRVIFSALIYLSGFLLIGFYQRYLGPWWTGGLAFHYIDRYAAVGGDGLGILNTFIHHPFLIISQLFIAEKIKTFLKIFVYFGFLPVIAIVSKKYRLLMICVWLGCIPYFIQVGLSSYFNMYHTGTQYISSLGAQWWVLSVLGVYTITEEKNVFSFLRRIFQNRFILPVFFLLFFLNSSEWRKSPIYPLRGFFEKESVDTQVRHYLSALPKEKGVFMVGTEWLCPLVADERYHLLCESGEDALFVNMPIDVVVSTQGNLRGFYDGLSDTAKHSPNGLLLADLLVGNTDKIHWKKVFEKSQTKLKELPINYFIWQKEEK